ncbi:hypothetical protein [Arenicella chitinivorans]|nr:hypothetical protein [Arenicella chitinivorans]
MIHNTQIKLLFVSLLLVAPAHSAEWNITQSTALRNAPTMTQVNSANAKQAINGISVDLANDDVVNSLQNTLFGFSSITMTQSGVDGNSSVQAVNLMEGRSIQNALQATTGFSSVTMTQDADLGGSNTQAANYAKADQSIENLAQSAVGNRWNAAPQAAGSVQALNYAEASQYYGVIAQSAILFKLNANLSAGELRVNSIQGGTGSAGLLVQSSFIKRVSTQGRGVLSINHVAP